MIPVIDISRHQGAVDFIKMRSRGVEGVICRAGNGTKPDDRFDGYIPAAKAAGLKVGAYWFCNPKTGTPAIQGKMLADAHRKHGCDLPPMLDVEDYTNEPGHLPMIKGPAFATWIRTMADVVEQTERRPFFYSNAAYWDPWVGDTTFGTYEIIVARYPFYDPVSCAAHPPPRNAQDWDEWIMAITHKRPQVPKGWDTWDGWQFSAGYNGQGEWYGVSSADLDLNIVRDDVWARWLDVIPPAPLPKPPTDLAARAAATGADMPYIVIGNADNKNAPTRWAWNGLIKRLILDQAEYNRLLALEWLDPRYTQLVPFWMSAVDLDGYATV